MTLSLNFSGSAHDLPAHSPACKLGAKEVAVKLVYM